VVTLALLGATGLVGSALCRALRARSDYEARALVRGPDRLQPSPGLSVLEGSLESLPAQLFAHAPEVVVHFATQQIDSEGSGFTATNVEGTQRLLDALPASVRVFLYGSSLSVYGQGPQRGENEEALAIRPATPLARSRVEAERRILAAGRERGFSAVCLRPRFVLGRGDRHTLPGLLRVTRKGRGLGSGRQAFSVIDVDDYARAILAVAEHLRTAEPVQRGLHVGYTQPLSLADIQAALSAAFGLEPVARRLRLPMGPVNALASLGLGGLSGQAVKYQLVGQDHYVDVSALRSLGGGAIVDRDPREALDEAISWLKTQTGEGAP
jgi:nucleoside-diphosphate-sugar epimerase